MLARSLLVFSMLLPLAATAEHGVTAQRILIGQTLTLQGGKNDYGSAVMDGVKVAIDQVNRQGGVNGRQIELKVLDDDNQAAKAEANARQLITSDKVFLLFGSIEGGPSTAVMKASNELKVPFFGPMAGSPGLRTPHQPLVFPVRAEHKEEFRTLMTYARSLGMQRLAFLRADSDTGRQHLENVQRLAETLSLPPVLDLPFKSDIDEAALAAMARQLVKADIQVVFNHGSASLYERLIRQTRPLSARMSFYGVNSGSAQMVTHLGELSHGMVFAQVVPSPWERKTALTRAYQDAFAKAAPGRAFSYGSLEGYLTGRALTEALRRAGPTPTRASFINGLKNTTLDVEGLKISYRDGEHVGLPLVDLSIVTREGKFRH
ncbi:MAG: branched-chain amino acid transport system substrate-binding protein [Betaproteobacteria bacterium]|nr:branched-chain amino acid transport system substrate-binding protein [Betaproteobacteria bacterium]